MFIATPNDKNVSIWTKEGPSVQVCEEDIIIGVDTTFHMHLQSHNCKDNIVEMTICRITIQ